MPKGNEAKAATLLSDDFSDNSLDASKWIKQDTSGGDNIQESGEKINLIGGGSWGTTALVSQTNFTRAENLTFSAVVNHSSPNVMFGFKDGDAAYNYTNMVYGLYFYEEDGRNKVLIFENGVNTGEVGSGWSLDTDYKIAIVLKTTGAKYYIQGGVYGIFGSDSWTLLYESSNSSESNLKVGFTSRSTANPTMSMDDVLVSSIPPTIHLLITIQNVMLAKPTPTSISLMVKTNIYTNVVVDYGPDNSYGNTVTSSSAANHEILISDLNPSLLYHYKITASRNDDAQNMVSTNDSTFKTQLQSGSDFTFGIINDMQGCDFSDTISKIENRSPDIILAVGDNIDGQTAGTVNSFKTLWSSTVFDYMQDITNHIPLFVVLGNHDGGPSSYYDNGMLAYEQELGMPASESGGERYYSFDYGDAHFVVLNGTRADSNGGTIDNAQLNWLQDDLQSTDKKYKFVFDHFLVYGVDEGTDMTDIWRLSNYNELHDILKNNGVLAFFNGHRHVYNRYVKDGVFYISNPTAATGSCILNGRFGNDSYANNGGDLGTIDNARGDFAGFTEVSVSPSQANVVIYKNDGTLIDSFDLTPEEFGLNIPQNNVHIQNSTPAFFWNPSFDSGSGLAKYQLYIDGVLNQDNISVDSTSAISSHYLSCGGHSWYVRAVNNNGDFIDSSAFGFIIDCGGLSLPPAKPTLSDLAITFLDNGTLSFDNLPDTVTQIAISAIPDFGNASWEDISKKEELLQRYAGADKLYIKFRTNQGAVSDVITCEGDKIGTIGEGTDTSDTIDNNNQGSSTQALNDGDLVKTINSPDVYIIKYKNNKQYKRLILAPYIFNLYGHLKWDNIKTISQSQLDQFITSNLIKEAFDSIIYQLFSDGDAGKRKPLGTSTTYDPDSVYEINKPEQDSYEAMN
ncbi:MAG: metallophosphoesterase [Candidatus Pacebacteria bacterium]|nr:metallophosphoesterase [Candidatus Paceibacterota bacterium]